MRYIKVENNTPTNYSLEQLFIDYPDAVIYKKSRMPNEELLANYNVYSLITESLPYLAEDEIAEESMPEFKQGEWHQTWKIRKLTELEIQEIIKNREILLENTIGTNEKSVNFLANKELQEQRYEICKGCEAFTMLKTCRKCGCIMPLKVKIASAACPLEKW